MHSGVGSKMNRMTGYVHSESGASLSVQDELCNQSKLFIIQ